MIPACAALLPCTLTTRATIVPSPANGWYTKWKPSEAVTIVPEPAPDTVNVPLAKPALPATPTEPISPSDQTEGSGPSVGEVTVRLTVVVLVKPPDDPVIITVTVPVAAVLLATSVNVLVLPVLLGLNDAVTPLGRPDADKLTLLLKPFSGATVMVLVPLAPCAIVTLVGEVESEKFGGCGPAVFIDTLSNVAVAKEAVVRLLTASPMYTLGAMLTVWLLPHPAPFTPY